MFEYEKHYRECKQLNKPFIKARKSPKHGNYYVQIDLMTCNYELSNQEQKEIKKLVQNEIEFLKLNSKSDFQSFTIDNERQWRAFEEEEKEKIRVRIREVIDASEDKVSFLGFEIFPYPRFSD